MRRAQAVIGAVLLVLGTAFGSVAATRIYLTRVVRCNETARSLFSAGPKRIQIRLMNLGTATVFVGAADGSLSPTTGWPIHAGALAGNVTLLQTTAGMNCVTADVDSVQVGVLEEFE